LVGTGSVSGWREALIRSVVAGLVVLALLIQSLAAIGAPLSNHGPAGGEARGAIFSGAGRCVAESVPDKPERRENDHNPPCCVLCLACAFDGLPTLRTGGTDVQAAACSETLNSVEKSYAIPRQRPIGWASSWSSQAPPFFS
jgi:hypothetical protein